jgi:hypothetical protein
MLKRMWVNQPSKHQKFHKYHGLLVLWDAEKEVIYFTSGDVISMQFSIEYLSNGWPEHLK